MNFNQKFEQIFEELADFHSVFYQIVRLGTPILTDKIPTAAVQFNKVSGLIRPQWMFNPDFWNKSDDYFKKFIICHECLHIILNHGLRFDYAKIKNNSLAQRANVAMDVVINHLLVDRFGFNRSRIKDWKEYCWLETSFDPNITVASNQHFEYYYLLLQNNPSGQSKKLMDDHSGLGGVGLDDIINEAFNSLTPDEKEEIRSKISSNIPSNGRSPDGEGNWSFLNPEKIPIKKKWETIIKEWEYFNTPQSLEFDSWTQENRILSEMPRNMSLPTQVEDKPEKNKLDVIFYLDLSGSVYNLKDRFLGAAKSLNPKVFNVECYSFDTKVYPVDMKTNKAKGGGGTSFSILSKHLEGLEAEKKKKIKGIFCLSDGLGDNIIIEKGREKYWYWFLIENGYEGCIPKECNLYKLENFI